MKDDPHTSKPDLFGANWRRQLLARLAAERAYLLWQYRGLSAETLTTEPAAGSMTFKEVLLHTAAWDAFYTERLSLVENGRLRELEPLSPQIVEERNAASLKQFAAVPLEQALAACLKERAGFLAALQRLPDELLHKRLTLPWGERVRPRTWARRRFLHDMDHAADLADWRGRQPPETLRQIGPPFILRAILTTARKEFLSLVDLISDSERTSRPVCGVWTLKDLVGHLTDWEQVGVEGLRQLADGQTPEFDYEIPDFDSFNNANAAARFEQPWQEVWADFEGTRRDLMALFDCLPAESLSRPMAAPWDSTIPAYVWVLVWPGHDREHAVDVRGALALRNWPRRLTKHRGI